ncbi:MAG TPA: class III poly(R)-hydroxyalkanoic acid synthase subunit PhaC [Nostocaceae cyanobacterium]|nr:class III poly(R)-hydroxyalkanoic acid synthase subunit PhaC [Nostocaceae cyanobacterium]
MVSQDDFSFWLNFSQASWDYQLIMADVWLKTFEEMKREGEGVNKWQHFLRVWSRIFDKNFAQQFGSQKAVIIQGEFLKLAISLFSQQQEIFRELLKLWELPQKITIEIFSLFYQHKIEMGVTPKIEIYRKDKMVLYRFVSQRESVNIPILIVYALVNRPEILDFRKGRSFIAGLVKAGFDVYLIDWGYPSYEDRYLTLDSYINGYINDCVEIIRDRHNIPQVNLLGICQGGTFSLCYSSLYPEKVKNLITIVTPVDFHTNEGLLNVWSGGSLGSQALDIDLMVDMLGNIPGNFFSLIFLMLKPFQLGVEKYVDLIEIIDSEDKLITFLTMEKWIFDSPDQAGEAFRQFMKDFYQGNKLIKGNLEIGNKQVNLSKINRPVLNIYGTHDHLVPPNSSLALEKYIPNSDYTALSFPVGHIGMFVSSKVQNVLTPKIAEWLEDKN